MYIHPHIHADKPTPIHTHLTHTPLHMRARARAHTHTHTRVNTYTRLHTHTKKTSAGWKTNRAEKKFENWFLAEFVCDRDPSSLWPTCQRVSVVQISGNQSRIHDTGQGEKELLRVNNFRKWQSMVYLWQVTANEWRRFDPGTLRRQPIAGIIE